MRLHYRYRKRDGWLGILIVVISLVLSIAHQQDWLHSLNQAAVSNQPGLYKVIRFVDGDTITVDMNGKPEKIRLIGVDTPETHKPNTPVQCYGPAAAAYTKNLINKQPVRLVSDSESTNRDRYDRLLRYVFLADGTFINRSLIENGYGFYYPYFPFTKSADFAKAQTEAQTAHRGLWANCSPSQTDRGGWVSNNQ